MTAPTTPMPDAAVDPPDAEPPTDIAIDPPRPDVIKAPDVVTETPDIVVAQDVVVPSDVVEAPDSPAPVDAARPDVTAPPDAPPPPRDPPPLREYSRGMCPTLRGGPTLDTSQVTGFRSGTQTRQFRLIVPRNYDPAGTERWPLMFAYHWLNASSSSFVREGELETAAQQMRFIIVAPDRLENGSQRYVFSWPFAEVWGAPAELTFFDDMLTCVSRQFRIDPRRVHGVGVSAGALWMTYMSSTDRAAYLASIASLSGGLADVLGAWRITYTPQPNKFAALVLWGGSTDIFPPIFFEPASRSFRDALLRDRHFVVQCTHSAGHAVPPIDRPAPGETRFRFLWQFFLDHPYGVGPTDSPWRRSGLPMASPSWCNIPAMM